MFVVSEMCRPWCEEVLRNGLGTLCVRTRVGFTVVIVLVCSIFRVYCSVDLKVGCAHEAVRKWNSYYTS